jgi:hypothetical protein
MQKIVSTAFVWAFACCMAFAQDYSNASQQTERLQALTKKFPQFTQLKSVTTTAGNKNIWLLTIGTGKTVEKPAIAVIGGVEGNYVIGTELAIGFAENFLAAATDSIQKVLNKTTFYIFPNMSVDAMEQYFAKLQFEKTGNATNTDNDRDGKINEDDVDDIDANGKITVMRIESPIGEFKTHPDDARVLIKADITKGEKGKYIVLQEGIDNDKDGKTNEDGVGGIAFNSSLTYNHKTFTSGAGEFPVSEKENRAMLDFLYDAFNVYTVVSFGSNNNLSTPVAFNAAGAAQKLLTSWLEPDVKVNSLVSNMYNKLLDGSNAPKTMPQGGDVLSWAYYHYGRFSFSTPGWWVPKAKPDTAKKEKPFTVEDATANYLRWSAQQGINNFTEWKKVNHPDYPNQTVEVGGLHPFVLINPPYKMANEVVKKHTNFLIKLAELQPELDIIDVTTEKLGGNITRVNCTIINKGVLPTHTKLGERNYFVKKVKAQINTATNQSIVGGKKIHILNSIEGNGIQKLSWLVQGNGSCIVEVACPTAGSKTISINL